MTILREVKSLPSTPKDLRKFGLTVGIVFLLLAGWFVLRRSSVWPWFLAPGIALIIPALLFPRILRPAFLVWMTLGLFLGLIVSTILLTLFFYLVVSPVGLAARLLGKDFLSLKLQRSAPSYWLVRAKTAPKTRGEYGQQF